MFLPKQILIGDLSYQAKIFYFYIVFGSNNDIGLKMSLMQISRNLKISKPGIVDCIKELEEQKLIMVHKNIKEDKSHGVNLYQIR